MKKILILVLMFLVVGCTNESKNIDLETPTGVMIFNNSEDNEAIVGGMTVELFAIVNPSNASQEVIWSSSDENIATVSDSGVVTGINEGSVTITVKVKDYDFTDSIDLFVYDDNRNLKAIDEIIDYLDTIIPESTTEDIALPSVLEGARLSWKSSNESIISIIGRVSLGKAPESVTLTADVRIGRVRKEFEKEVMVDSYTLRDISNRKVSFAYLYDHAGSFTGFNDGDLDKIDVINYAFGGIRNGELALASSTRLPQIVSESHKAGVRVVLAIGGWGVDGFSDASLTKDSRKIFIDSILEGIDKYHLDGIDFDWEYPTSTAGGLIKARPEDKQNFTHLVVETYEALKAKNPDLTLSIAVPNGSWAAQSYYEVNKIKDHIDYLHLMSYDMINFATASNKIVKSSHHTNLLPSSNAVSSATSGINAYHSLGIPKEKIVLGIAFYGHGFKVSNAGNNGMGADTDTAVAGNKFTISYRAIVNDYLSNPETYTVYYDDAAKASWLYGNGTVISYDDPRSIAAKCDYVNDNDLGGVMFWQYSQDHTDSILVNAIFDNLNK
ncbi:MAG: glycosyl hydrolase family 18 protein [Bacilli bacterium]